MKLLLPLWTCLFLSAVLWSRGTWRSEVEYRPLRELRVKRHGRGRAMRDRRGQGGRRGCGAHVVVRPLLEGKMLSWAKPWPPCFPGPLMRWFSGWDVCQGLPSACYNSGFWARPTEFLSLQA